MIPRTFFLLNSNGNNTFNRRRPKSQIFCCPHFVMISLLGIGQKSSHVCFSADFSTQTRMAWGQILTWFWRFTVGDEQRGTWDNWITKEKTWNVGCLQKYMRFFDRLSFVWYYLVQHMYRPLWGLAHLINGKYSTNRQLVSVGRFWWILLISSPLNRNLSHLAYKRTKKFLKILPKVLR